MMGSFGVGVYSLYRIKIIVYGMSPYKMETQRLSVCLCVCVYHLPDWIGFIFAFHHLFFRYSLPAKIQDPVKFPSVMCEA